MRLEVDGEGLEYEANDRHRQPFLEGLRLNEGSKMGKQSGGQTRQNRRMMRKRWKDRRGPCSGVWRRR